MTTLTIKSLQTVVAGKFVDQFVVVDESGNLIGSKAHKTHAEAEVELGGLKYYAQGLEFARATAKEGVTEKALVGKANIVAAFLMYQEQVAAGTFGAEAAEEVVEETTEAESVVETADEEF